MLELLQFINLIINLIIWILIISAVLSWLIVFNVVPRHNRTVYLIADSLNRLVEPLLAPIRRRVPNYGGLDISPLILILILYFIQIVIIPNILKIT
jgi:YggT family protein